MPELLGFISTARELARFGLLIQANGQWNGRTIVEDKDYLREALSPSQAMNPTYGFLWRLNGRPVRRADGIAGEMLNPEAPPDMVCAIGAGGRYVFVAPGLGIVATRTGDQADLKGESPFAREFWKRLAKAVAAR
jgi:CubicO group peptidase (beta-lactamase class C family)